MSVCFEALDFVLWSAGFRACYIKLHHECGRRIYVEHGKKNLHRIWVISPGIVPSLANQMLLLQHQMTNWYPHHFSRYGAGYVLHLMTQSTHSAMTNANKQAKGAFTSCVGCARRILRWCKAVHVMINSFSTCITLVSLLRFFLMERRIYISKCLLQSSSMVFLKLFFLFTLLFLMKLLWRSLCFCMWFRVRSR